MEDKAIKCWKIEQFHSEDSVQLVEKHTNIEDSNDFYLVGVGRVRVDLGNGQHRDVPIQFKSKYETVLDVFVYFMDELKEEVERMKEEVRKAKEGMILDPISGKPASTKKPDLVML